MTLRNHRLAAAAALLFAGTLRAQTGGEPGDLWEVTTEMSMQGMVLPPQTARSCAAKNWTEPPVPEDEDRGCETLDFATSGSKVTWKVRCAGPPEMTGEGEIVRQGAAAYTGNMKLTAPQGVMTLKLAGKRVGDCDASEGRRQMEQIQAQQVQGEQALAQAQLEMCRGLVAAMDLNSLRSTASSVCTDPSLKTDFCARLGTPQGFEAVGACAKEEAAKTRYVDAAAYCAQDQEQLRTGLCKDALEDETLDFLGDCCPVEAQAVALEQCAGRSYTALSGSKYQSFCVAYARQEAVAPQAKPETTKDKAKKALKGMFGR